MATHVHRCSQRPASRDIPVILTIKKPRGAGQLGDVSSETLVILIERLIRT